VPPTATPQREHKSNVHKSSHTHAVCGMQFASERLLFLRLHWLVPETRTRKRYDVPAGMILKAAQLRRADPGLGWPHTSALAASTTLSVVSSFC
jgi:hypothetical protein